MIEVFEWAKTLIDLRISYEKKYYFMVLKELRIIISCYSKFSSRPETEG
jgi:hypothetical protein